jgi:hypothetical protein
LPEGRKRRSHVERRLEIPSVIAVLFALALIACIFWMGATGNRFCCDPKSLLRQLVAGKSQG